MSARKKKTGRWKAYHETVEIAPSCISIEVGDKHNDLRLEFLMLFARSLGSNPKPFFSMIDH